MTTGQLLIVLNREFGNKMGPLHRWMTEVLKADVIRKLHEDDLVIRNVCVNGVDDNDHAVATEGVWSLRMAYGQTQVAIISVPAGVSRKAIGDKSKSAFVW